MNDDVEAGYIGKRRAWYYVEDSEVQFEEDLTHEFKGHRNVTDEELPAWAYISGTDKRSRKGIARTIISMLNTGLGGTVYCGILDSGRVKGLHLTQYNKDHFVAAVDDVMASFTPHVSERQYKVKFVPVVDAGDSRQEVDRILRYDSSQSVDPESRKRNHVVRTQEYCWCDKDKCALLNNGILPQKYVIELIVKPWKESHGRHLVSASRLNLHPVYENEDGVCYIRRNASTIALEPDQVYAMGRQDAMEYYEKEIAKVKNEIERLRNGASLENNIEALNLHNETGV